MADIAVSLLDVAAHQVGTGVTGGPLAVVAAGTHNALGALKEGHELGQLVELGGADGYHGSDCFF